ncbi:MAG: hypothetical protein K0Q51_582 [Rickettsiaceae bacterium]|jgi:hypothetical protein|nr:hypothetical protein [Rickettsiaceae bacterium]
MKMQTNYRPSPLTQAKNTKELNEELLSLMREHTLTVDEIKAKMQELIKLGANINDWSENRNDIFFEMLDQCYITKQPVMRKLEFLQAFIELGFDIHAPTSK